MTDDRCRQLGSPGISRRVPVLVMRGVMSRLLGRRTRSFWLVWRDLSRRKLLSFLLAIVAIVSLCPGASAGMRVHALLIGNNAPFPDDEPGVERQPLRYADDDAAAMFEFLRESGVSAQLLTLMDAQSQRTFPALAAVARVPTKAHVVAAVDRLIRQAASDQAAGHEVSVIIFYSGHGAIAYEGEPALALLDAGLKRDFLYDEVLARIPASFVHLLVDACHAEAVVRPRDDGRVVSVTSQQARDLLIRTTLDRFPNVGAILASTTGARAHEWDEIGHGIFTHELLSALRGAADVNRDHRLEYSEVAAFMYAANRGIVDPAARLDVVARPPVAHRRAPILELNPPANGELAWLTGVKGNNGRMRVLSTDGRTLVSINGADDYFSDLLLPRHAKVTIDDERKEATFVAVAQERVPFDGLEFVQRHTRSRSLEEDLRRGLFASRFGPGYYSGFVDRSPEFIAVSLAPIADANIADLGEHSEYSKAAGDYALIAGAAGSNAIAHNVGYALGGLLTLRPTGGNGPFAHVEVLWVAEGGANEWTPTGSVGWAFGGRHGLLTGWGSISIGGGTIEQRFETSSSDVTPPGAEPRFERARSPVVVGAPGLGAAVDVADSFSLWAEAQLRVRGYRKLDEGVAIAVDPAAWLGIGLTL